MMRSLLVTGAILLGGMPLLHATTQNDLPNVVLILADDLGFGDVHALQPESAIPTPALDRLAGEGMTFLDAHSPSGVCTPTRYGLLTGRYCWRSRLKSGVLGGYSPPLLENGRQTIADVLRARGYRTGAFGKWHLGMELPKQREDVDTRPWSGDPGIDFAGTITNGPTHHGFDAWFGVTASLDMAPYVFVRNDRFTMLPTLQQEAVGFPHFIREGPRAEDFVVDEVLDRITEEAVAFIQQAAAQPQPFFVYVPLTAPHKPTQPHERFRGRTGLNEYGDFVHAVDDSVRRLLEALDQAQVTDRTLLVFTSDNGSYMNRFEDLTRRDHQDDAGIQGYRSDRHRANGPFRGTKADVFEGGHHVPFFVRWPGQVAAGSRSTRPITHTDLFATVAEIAGAVLDENTAEDSWSFLPLLKGQDVPRAAPVVNHSANGMFAVRQGAWKLILGNGSGGREQPKGKPFEEPYQLYHLGRDIAESENLVEQHPDLVLEMIQALEEIRTRGRSFDR